MLLIPIDRSSTDPLFRQVYERTVEMVESGVLKEGERLPPTRAWAERLGIHRSTVVRAYDELKAKGYVESKTGSYTTVRRRTRWPGARVGDSPPPEREALDWAAGRQAAVRSLRSHPAMEQTHPGVAAHEIDFEHLSADPALAPVADLRRYLRRALMGDGGVVLDYSDAAGWPPLRECIADRLRLHGVAVHPEEILITAGAQQALDLILRLLVKPGDAVVVEAPTYGMGLALLRLHGARPVEVPLGDGGMELDRLEELLKRERPRLVFTMPNFQNPTGVTTPQAHRERLLGLCENHGVLLLEDGFDEEMKYFGQAVLPIKSMDTQGIVLYVGTFSKVVFPGLRLGWIAASRTLVEDLAALYFATCFGGNTLAQAAAAQFLSDGAYEAYLRRMHRVFRRRMQTIFRGLGTHLPEGCLWTRPEGGYTVWLTLPPGGGSEEEVVGRCRDHGVLVSPGRRYFLTPPKERHLRLSISRVNRAQIQEGCRRLGRVLEG